MSFLFAGTPGVSSGTYSLTRALSSGALSHYSKFQPSQADDAAVFIRSATNGLSVSNVEKHLNDYEKGKGNLSKAIATNLARADRKNADILSGSNPGAQAEYLLYGTALNYEQKARYVQSMDETTSNIARIHQAQDYELPLDVQRALEEYQKVQEQQDTSA